MIVMSKNKYNLGRGINSTATTNQHPTYLNTCIVTARILNEIEVIIFLLGEILT